MSKLEKLIQDLCPNGVEYKCIGELGKFYGGLTGKSKDDFKDGNAKFISYRNVYSNYALDIDTKETVKIKVNEKQKTLQYGDVVFTGSSENTYECGISSVLTKRTEEPLYLNSFCFFLRFDNPKLFLPDFTKHLFRCNNLRYQIGKTASGVTRFNVSKDKMKKVVVPVPPMEVQNEIVRILDNFTELSAELSAELSDRKKQYEYYRDSLFSNLSSNAVEYKNLGEVAKVNRGSRLTKSKLLDEAEFEVYHGSKDTPLGKYDKYNVEKGKVIVVNTGGIGGVKYIENKFWCSDGSFWIDESVKLNSKYLYYYLSKLEEYFYSKKRVGGVPTIERSVIENVSVPVPPMEVQNEIVGILDKLESLCSDITTGLPAEIELRKKQYEYYRDKLLTFKEAENLEG